MQAGALDILQTVLQWIVAPVAGVVFMIYREQQRHATDIAVLKSEALTNKQAHDREMKEIREMHDKIFQKLNSIEEALRK